MTVYNYQLIGTRFKPMQCDDYKIVWAGFRIIILFMLLLRAFIYVINDHQGHQLYISAIDPFTD